MTYSALYPAPKHVSAQYQAVMVNIELQGPRAITFDLLAPQGQDFFFGGAVYVGPYPWHKETPRLGVQSELQLPTYATATAMPGLSHICNLHHSSWQHQIPNPLSEARD